MASAPTEASNTRSASPLESASVRVEPVMLYDATLGRRSRNTFSTAVSAGPHAICVLTRLGPMVSLSPSTLYGPL